MKKLLTALCVVALGAGLVAGCSESRTDRVGGADRPRPSPSASPSTAPTDTTSPATPVTPPPSPTPPATTPSTPSESTK